MSTSDLIGGPEITTRTGAGGAWARSSLSGGMRIRSARRRLGIATIAVAACSACPRWPSAAFPGTDPPRARGSTRPTTPTSTAARPTTRTRRRRLHHLLRGGVPRSSASAPTRPTRPPPCARSPPPRPATSTAPSSTPQGTRAANVGPAGDLASASQIAGIRADTAWKYSTGDPDVVGRDPRHRDPLAGPRAGRQGPPQRRRAAAAPARRAAPTAPADDCNGDGAFNVSDFAGDSRVVGRPPATTGGRRDPRRLRPDRDLLADGEPTRDANGYVDDIAGWDFFDDDNDPFDASSCCSANGHGTGRAARGRRRDEQRRTASPGICPECQIMPLRVWDTFVVPTDNFAMGVDLRGRQRRQRGRGRGRRARPTPSFARSAVQLRRRARASR